MAQWLSSIDRPFLPTSDSIKYEISVYPADVIL